jgi:hypothetical protein
MEAARLPLTIPHLDEQATEIWRLIGNGALATAATSCVRSTGN